MNHYDQNQPPVSSYPQTEGQYAAPTLVGYPVKDGPTELQVPPPETRSKGDGFWKGCCAALCCCCLLDACF